MKKLMQQLFYTISYWRVDDSIKRPQNKDFMILINQYMFLLICIFAIQTMFTIFIIGFNSTILILIAISVLLGLTFTFPRKLVKNKYVIAAVFFVLTVIITYYASFCGVESGVFLYYFPLISAVYFFFSWSKHRLLIIILMLFILINLYLSAIFNFQLVERGDIYNGLGQQLLILNISCMLLILALNSYFFLQKKEDYYFVLNKNFYKREQIENLNDEVCRLRKMLNTDIHSEDMLKDLLASAELNDVIFLEKFDAFFPDFSHNLNNTGVKSLSISDRKVCAMLKLGFTTKQIAIYSNSTIKSVDGKIYRLRKKLGIRPDVDSKTWFSAL